MYCRVATVCRKKNVSHPFKRQTAHTVVRRYDLIIYGFVLRFLFLIIKMLMIKDRNSEPDFPRLLRILKQICIT